VAHSDFGVWHKMNPVPAQDKIPWHKIKKSRKPLISLTFLTLAQDGTG
jgi:hypothetical protein